MEVKSRIEARSEALSYACVFLKDRVEVTSEMVITFAKVFEQYIVGDAELPEIPEDTNTMLRDYLNKMTDAIKREERNDIGLMGYTPTKS